MECIGCNTILPILKIITLALDCSRAPPNAIECLEELKADPQSMQYDIEMCALASFPSKNAMCAVSM